MGGLHQKESIDLFKESSRSDWCEQGTTHVPGSKGHFSWGSVPSLISTGAPVRCLCLASQVHASWYPVKVVPGRPLGDPQPRSLGPSYWIRLSHDLTPPRRT